jgi:hypothetical protein
MKFDRQVVFALQQKRRELQHQIANINDALELYVPKPPIKRRPPDMTVAQEKIFNAASGSWQSTSELARKVGMRVGAASRTINNMAREGKLETHTVNGVPHFRRKTHELRLVAGEGELK